MENEKPVQEQPTPEQIKDQRNKIDSYYKELIPYLETQLQYEQLLTRIQECKTQRLLMQIQIAQSTATPEEQTDTGRNE